MLDQPSPYLSQTAACLTEGWATCIMPHFRNPKGLKVQVKGLRTTANGLVEKDISTIADNKMGPFMRAYIQATEPDRVMVDEENRKVITLLNQLHLGKKAMLDNLDGTEWFAAGLPDFGVLYSTSEEGIGSSAFILCTIEKADGTMDCEILMGNAESGVWHIAGIGHMPVRVLPFADRPSKPDNHISTAVITARYFENGLLNNQDLLQRTLTKANETIDMPALLIKEAGSAVRMWSDFLLGKVDFVAATPTRPWDQNAGGYLTQVLGGVAKSMDNWEDYKQSRIDGGIAAAHSEIALMQMSEQLFTTGAGPMGREPCVPDLLKPIVEAIQERQKNETKNRLIALAGRNPPACISKNL